MGILEISAGFDQNAQALFGKNGNFKNFFTPFPATT
jgi:hypothetical protein